LGRAARYTRPVAANAADRRACSSRTTRLVHPAAVLADALDADLAAAIAGVPRAARLARTAAVLASALVAHIAALVALAPSAAGLAFAPACANRVLADIPRRAVRRIIRVMPEVLAAWLVGASAGLAGAANTGGLNAVVDEGYGA
jgi:hypothetical protein